MPIEPKIIVEVKKGGKMSEQEERNLINIEKDIYHSPFTFSFYVNLFSTIIVLTKGMLRILKKNTLQIPMKGIPSLLPPSSNLKIYRLLVFKLSRARRQKLFESLV